MILENTLNLIQEIKLKHLAIGAGGLATAAGLAAHSGLLGYDLQNSIDSAGHAISHAGTGFKAGQAVYDLSHTRDNSNFIDRNISGLGGIKTLAQTEYNARQGVNNIIGNTRDYIARTISNPDSTLKGTKEIVKGIAKEHITNSDGTLKDTKELAKKFADNYIPMSITKDVAQTGLQSAKEGLHSLIK